MESIEFCRAADLPELFSLFADWYSFNPRMQERDYFDWQFRDAPVRLGPGEYDFLILRDERGKITGALGVVGFELHIGDRIERGGWTHNWHGAGSGFGGLALYTRYSEMVDCRFSIRITERVQQILGLLDVPILPAMPRWWAIVDPDRAERLFGPLESRDQRTFVASAEMLSRAEPGRRLEQVTRLDPAVEFRLAHWPQLEGYARRDARYLNWRYFDIPRHNYRLVRSECAFCVYRIETIMGTDASVARILEWTFGPDETGAALRSILADAEFTHPVLIDFHCTAAPIGRSLAPYGFRPQDATERPMPDLFRPTNHSGGYAVAADLPPHRTSREFPFDRWYVTIGDGDVDRIKL